MNTTARRARVKEVKTTTQREENGFRSYIHHIQERVAPGDSMHAGNSCIGLVFEIEE